MMKGSKSDLNLFMVYFVLSFRMVARSGKDQTQISFLMYPWHGRWLPFQFWRWPLSKGCLFCVTCHTPLRLRVVLEILARLATVCSSGKAVNMTQSMYSL